MHIRSVTHKHLNFAITGTRITEALQRYGIQLEDLPLFLFLDLSRTTGTDVKRPYRDRAGLTVGKEQTVTEIIQAAMRERQLLLDDAQSIIWVLFKSLYQQINSTNEQFDPKQLFYWMLRNEAKQIENKVIMRAYQGIYQLIEGIIWKRIHNKQVPYSDYSERLEQFVNLSPYHRYEQESILYKPQIVLRAYIYMLCDSFSIPIGHLPSSISRLLNQIINDTSQLVGNLRSTDNTALNEEVYQEQQSEIEQQQEIIEEQKIKSLFDQHSNFKFAIEYYDTSDQLDNIFSNKKDPASCYQDLKFSRCQALKTPKLLLCKKHFMPLAGNYKSYEITQLKPIRMLLVYFHTNAEYEFLAISAAGSEYFVNEINRLNTASPHHTYAIIGLGASILYASKSLTQEQRTTLPESFQLRQMVTFIGLLNGHINNPPILMQIAQQYQWNTKKYHCLVDEISRIHVSRHPIDLKSMLNFNKKDEYSYKPTAISRGFTTLILTPTMKVTNRTSNFRYLSKPESILPGSILGNTPVPYVSKEFHDAAHVECEFDQNHISFEDTAVCDAHKPQTSSTSRLTTPFAALVQLTSWFRNTVTSFAQLEAQESIDPHIQSDHPSTKNKDFVRSALSPALISTEQSCDKAPQPFQVCTPTMYGNENDGYIPTLTCSGPSYQTVVFPKTSNSNAVSSYTEGSSTISGDIYNPQSCRPIEFHGRPSVYCEGEQTTFVYTPEFSQRPLENLGANIMLGAVAIHMAYSSYQWIKDKFLGVDDSQLNEIEYIVNKEYFYLQVCKIQTALQKAEAQLNKLQTVMHPKNCEWATFSIEEFRYDLDNLINKFKKGRITQEELNECNDDVLYLLQEIKLEVKCCQQLPAGLYYQGVPWDAIALHEGVSQQRPRRQVAECLEHETDISATQKNRDHRTRINYSNTKLCFTESYLSHKQRTNYAIFTATSSTCPVEHNLTSDVTKYTKTIRTITQFI